MAEFTDFARLMSRRILIGMASEQRALKKFLLLLTILLFIATVAIIVITQFVHRTSATGTITGTITYGPTNPLGGLCAAPASQTEIAFIAADHSSHRVTTDRTGAYTITLPMADYSVMLGARQVAIYSRIQNTIGRNNHVTVLSDKTTTFNGCYDTGIR